MATLGTRIFTWLHGEYVGNDEFGNSYYRSKKKHAVSIGRPNTERRWVIYKHIAEPSLVPPYWHGWLHHITDEPPTEEDKKRHYNWQKNHKPNMTGTKEAYFPPGHVRMGGERSEASSDYEPWTP